MGDCNSPLDISKASLPYFKNICIPCYSARSEACWHCLQSSGLFIFWATLDLRLSDAEGKARVYILPIFSSPLSSIRVVSPPIEKASATKFNKLLWVIAIVLLISRKLPCHTIKTYAYPVIQQRSEACWHCPQSSGLFIFWGWKTCG